MKSTTLIMHNGYKVINASGSKYPEWDVFKKDKSGKWRHIVTYQNTMNMLKHIEFN